MKSFQNFTYNISEKRTNTGYGKPSGYDAQGEPMYTTRPGPKEKGRRATVQKSPKTVTQVKNEIEAAKKFSGVKSGGLETRNVPSFVTKKRIERANKLLGPSPWDMPGGVGAGQKTFDRGMRKLVSPRGPSKGHQERALRDFIRQSSKEYGTSTDEIIASMLKGKSSTPLTSPLAAPDPWRPSQTETPSSKPKAVSQAKVSKKQAEYRQAQKTSPTKRPTTTFGGTPKAASFSTPTRSKSASSPKTSVIDVEVLEPKKPQKLNLGTEPGGKMEPRGAQRTPTKGVTGGLGPVKNKYTIEPVTVKVLDGKKRSLGSAQAKPKVSGVTLPKPPKPSLKSKVATTTVAPVKPKELKIPKPSTPKIKPLSATKTTQSQRLADTVVKASKQIRSDIAAEKAAAAATRNAKALKIVGGAGKALGAIGTGLEAKKAYDIARSMGGSKRRAIGAGAARAIGSGLGGIIGGAVGSPLGPIGTATGATAGLTIGAELGSKAYDVITGDPRKKLTTRGVLSNIRKAIPQSVRSQVPADVRKGFTDFVKSTGKTYGNWRRSQENTK